MQQYQKLYEVPQPETSKPRRNRFLVSLYDTLENPLYENAISWDIDGKAFTIKNPTLFEERVLMEDFSGLKFNSFIRQLSYYGFKRLSGRSSGKVYSHELFRRNQRNLFKQIKRNKKEVNTTVESSNALNVIENKFNLMEIELRRLRTENLTLRSCIQMLSKKLDEKNAVNPSTSNGFNQTFFNFKDANNCYSFSNDMQQIPNNIPKQDNFTEIYQPDCRVHQAKETQRNFNEIDNSPQIETPFYEESEMNNLYNYSGEESQEVDYWRSGDSVECDFSYFS